MITSTECFERFGNPRNERGMVVWNVPSSIRVGSVLPKRIYCNKYMVAPLTRAFEALRWTVLLGLIDSWDGCFNIRAKRGAVTQSLHSWGLAVDINAATNRFGQVPSMDPRVVEIFKEAGFDWGGDWKKPDGMHFQLREFPEE